MEIQRQHAEKEAKQQRENEALLKKFEADQLERLEAEKERVAADLERLRQEDLEATKAFVEESF